jgi:hypothetical protein
MRGVRQAGENLWRHSCVRERHPAGVPLRNGLGERPHQPIGLNRRSQRDPGEQVRLGRVRYCGDQRLPAESKYADS